MIELIKDKEILVVGMARSGIAAAELLAGAGASRVTVTDQKSSSLLERELKQLGRFKAVECVTGGNPPELVSAALSMIVKSPGVPPTLPLFGRAAELGIPLLSEIELAYAFIRAPLVGITGTNGKTTTTALTAAMLREAGFDPVHAAGNIGTPLSGLAGRVGAQGLVVAELSSFQLDNIMQFRPKVAVFINFAEDHLDYHGSREHYFRAKARIIENQVGTDLTVLNAADPDISSLALKTRGRVIWFDQKPVPTGVGLGGNMITLYNANCRPVEICSRSELNLPGEHNLENVLAASAAAWAAGADPTAIGEALRSFRPIEHRLEAVRTLSGVDYINDSKATNPGATVRALSSYPGRPVILIAGGKDKGADFTELAAVIRSRVKMLLLIGETKDRLARAVEETGFTGYRLLASLEEAVRAAAAEATGGDIVMLSPACASWDMFSDYEERGRLFKELVGFLPPGSVEKGGVPGG